MASNDPTTEELLGFALSIVARAGALALKGFNERVPASTKPDGSPVTDSDLAVERLLRDAIASTFPAHQVAGEEFGAEEIGGSAGAWLIDPIDGTALFARGDPGWGVLLSFVRNGRPEIGIISMPAVERHYWAGAGLGAYSAPVLEPRRRDVQRLYVSATKTLASATALYQTAAVRRVEAAWTRSVASTREEGPLVGPILVASGRADAMLVGGELEPWEVAPVEAIVTEAGGKVTDLHGVSNIDARICLVSNGSIHDPMLLAMGTPVDEAGKHDPIRD